MNLLQECLTPWALVINQVANHPDCSQIYASGIPDDSISFLQYLLVFFKTYTFELPLYYVFLRKSWNMPKILLVNLVINLATHPIIYLLMPIIFLRFDMNYLQYLVIAEIFAPAVEAILLSRVFKISWKTAVAAALVANLFSWTAGVIWG